MTARLVAIVGALLLLSDFPHQEALIQRKPDVENIQGEGQSEEGLRVKEPSKAAINFVGKMAEMRFTNPDETIHMEFRLDERGTPKRIDFIENPLAVMPGIYMLDRDRLTIALAWSGGQRPVSFAACTKKRSDGWGYYEVVVFYCKRPH